MKLSEPYFQRRQVDPNSNLATSNQTSTLYSKLTKYAYSEVVLMFNVLYFTLYYYGISISKGSQERAGEVQDLSVHLHASLLASFHCSAPGSNNKIATVWLSLVFG